MADYVVYHKPETMGYPASEVDSLSVITDKSPVDPVGSRVWLITGEGKPRCFYLRACFIVDAVERSGDSRFHTRMRGTDGYLFDPMPSLDAEDWFSDFKRSQQNFRFGFQAIGDPKFVAGLEAVARHSPQSRPASLA